MIHDAVPVVLRVPVSRAVWTWLNEKGEADPFGPFTAEEMAARLILEAIDFDRLCDPADDPDIPF